MSRYFLLGLIFIAGTLLVGLIFQERQRSRELVLQANEIFASPETPDVARVSEPATTSIQQISGIQQTSGSTTPTEPSTPNTQLTTNPDAEVTTGESVETSASPVQASNVQASDDVPTPVVAATEAPASTDATGETSTEPAACSSFDEAGLLAAFDGALAAFINDASSVYGNQYQNLQYELSSRTGVIAGEEGTVTTNYSGTVQELSTGQDVSANGTIRATFAWDGCTWQVVDYSF